MNTYLLYYPGYQCFTMQVPGFPQDDWWTDGLTVEPFLRFPVANGRLLPADVLDDRGWVVEVSYAQLPDLERQGQLRPLASPIRVVDPFLPGWLAVIRQVERQPEGEQRWPSWWVAIPLALVAWVVLLGIAWGVRWILRHI